MYQHKRHSPTFTHNAARGLRYWSRALCVVNPGQFALAPLSRGPGFRWVYYRDTATDMPPKKPAQPTGNKKTQEKKKEKIIEDKTFGLKNKKGAKQQKFIKAVTQQVKYGQQNARQVAAAEANKKGDKKKEISELNELFKPVVAAQKVSKGVDPKSVLCAFFKQGQCTKGDKCKFSHDLSLDRKCEKRSVYVDVREEELEKDTMENWDEKKLEEVVNKKHGEAEKKKAKTQIVCKYFLEAIENNKYGWFWVCPAGGDSCMYRHALPVGFVLKKDKKMEEKEEDKISLEELIENERAALGANVTRITLETFLAWKKRKRQEKMAKIQQDMERKKADFKAGRALGVSGREVFEFRPELVDDDDEEADDTKYATVDDDDDFTPMVEDEEEEEQCQDIDVARFVLKEVDSAGITVAAADRFSRVQPSSETDDHKLSEASGGIENGEDHTLEEGGASTDSDGGGAGDEEAKSEAVPVDENLFTGEDLDELEEELNTLDLDE
ncbi:zinc finger CCCH domain-containing protein 15 [Ictalurus furcatus]|uniref:zinc finger CCCH domain-containing protein 15 n=1 Tax=Ictalurus furcatus TaxID=66913 RepID=UPI0023507BA8|nr:zinc finger CCCH domain-containing protein 15 [Ictalurus furcatus]